MPLRENIKTAFRECNELRAEVERLKKASSANCATHGKQSIGLCAACQKVEKDALRVTIRRLIEMVGAAYTAGWMAGYTSYGSVADIEEDKNFCCDEDWVEDGLRAELLKIIESA